MPPPRRSSPRWNGKCSRAIGSNHLARHRLLCLTGATGSTTTTVGTAPSAWSALSTTRTLRPPTGKPHRGNLHDSGGTTIGRLRKYWGTKNATKTVPVSGEKVRLERELDTEANRDDAMSGWVLVAEEHEFTLLGDKAVVVKETVVLEREL